MYPCDTEQLSWLGGELIYQLVSSFLSLCQHWCAVSRGTFLEESTVCSSVIVLIFTYSTLFLLWAVSYAKRHYKLFYVFSVSTSPFSPLFYSVTLFCLVFLFLIFCCFYILSCSSHISVACLCSPLVAGFQTAGSWSIITFTQGMRKCVLRECERNYCLLCQQTHNWTIKV